MPLLQLFFSFCLFFPFLTTTSFTVRTNRHRIGCLFFPFLTTTSFTVRTNRRHTQYRHVIPLCGFFDDLKSSISEAFVDSDGASLSAIEGLESSSPRRSALSSSQKQFSTSGCISPSQLSPVTVSLSFYLTGIPEKDASSDLWQKQVKITGNEYDQQLRVAFPSEPQQSCLAVLNDDFTVTVSIPDSLSSSSSDFIPPQTDGAWKLSFEGGRNLLRLGISQLGFSRVVRSGGTMESVYGGAGNSAMKSASSLPPGRIYADFEILFGGTPGTFEIKREAPLPLVKCESASGLLKVVSLVSCGRVEAAFVYPDEEGK